MVAFRREHRCGGPQQVLELGVEAVANLAHGMPVRVNARSKPAGGNLDGGDPEGQVDVPLAARGFRG